MQEIWNGFKNLCSTKQFLEIMRRRIDCVPDFQVLLLNSFIMTWDFLTLQSSKSPNRHSCFKGICKNNFKENYLNLTSPVFLVNILRSWFIYFHIAENFQKHLHVRQIHGWTWVVNFIQSELKTGKNQPTTDSELFT